MSKGKWMGMGAVLGLCWALCAGASPPRVPYSLTLIPGTPAEQAVLIKSGGSTVVDGGRIADVSQFWMYGFPVAAGESCLLTLDMDDKGKGAVPNVSVLGPDNKPIPVRVERNQDNTVQAVWTVPDAWPLGNKISVVLGAKTDPFRVVKVRFSVREPDKNGDGLPDNVALLLTQGLPPNTHISVTRTPDHPYTSLQTPLPPDPALEVPTDALFVYSPNADAIQGWKARGYTVWTMGGSRDGKAYADMHHDELQIDSSGNPLHIDDSFYMTPTPARNAIERSYYEQALANGSDGVCPEEPEFYARAGYSDAFKQAWQAQYKTPWQNPMASIDNWYRSTQLMMQMETDHVAAELQAAQTKPGARRMVALHSPINYAQWGIVAPQYRITSLPDIQDVVGQVWTGTARSPVRYEGIRSDRTFSLAYLEYSSLYQLMRGTGKKLWFLMDPLEDDPSRSQTDYKSHYEQTLIASLLFPDVDAYEVMPWPSRIYGHIPGDYTVEIGSAVAALEDMHEQRTAEGNPASGATIGVFVSDSMQLQREGPAASDFDGVFGLSLPLLEHGVPVQMVSLDRAADPGYLRPFKTLLLSYDFQKPPNDRVQAAIADWVRHGGTLLFFGGSDPYNALSDSWWVHAAQKSPQDDLWAKLGIATRGAATTVGAPEEDLSHYETILKTDSQEHDLRNRRRYTLDLTKYVQQTGSVAIRFSDAFPQDGWGPYLVSAELHVNGQIAAEFAAGSDIESRFLVYDHNSQFNGTARFADASASWTYQFDRLPPHVPIELTLDIGNEFLVSAKSVQPVLDHTLLGTGAVPALQKTFPRLRIDNAYPATIYPGMAGPPPPPLKTGSAAQRARPLPTALRAPGATSVLTPLYTLRSGGTPVWMQTVGEGLVMNVGVAPGFFSANIRSAGLLRALVQYGQQRAGGSYREPRSLRLRRGRYTILRTFEGREQVEGRTIDLLSPGLTVAEDRVIPSNTVALLYDLGSDDDPPHIGFVSGRVDARVETESALAFFVRGPLHTTGIARLHAGGKSLAGAKAMDRLGRPVEVQAEPEGNTVLLKYPNDPDGVIVRVGWK